jgi:hypothetical protein
MSVRNFMLLQLFLALTSGFCQRIMPLSSPPDWDRLNAFQETITHDEFVTLLSSIYAPGGAADHWITIEPGQALIRENATKTFVLRFAPAPVSRKPIFRQWSPAPEKSTPPDRPLQGMTIALDPGHLGGEWAKMEERWFQIGTSAPIMEGNMTLRVAQVLAPRLRGLGAKVEFVRSTLGPVNELRPEVLQEAAQATLRSQGVTNILPTFRGAGDPDKERSLPWEANLLFYRVGEIQARARIVNETIRPDLTLCLHFNAEPWGDPANPTLVDSNHLHLLVNGNYSVAELGYDDVRYAMLLKLLSRTYEEELPLSEAIAAALARVTRLPAYHYTSPSAKAIGSSGYVWARNLLANRLYECPVVYVECYVMNSREFFARFQAGEYQGLQEFGGVLRPNIYQEYVQGVVNGLADYFRAHRTSR